jgi:DNA modification methylase
MINKVFNEPCLDTLKRMADKSIDCVITSPPYWQLRDYGYDGQWGLEPTFQEYLEHLWELMAEIHRVLKDEGTCWVNLGDSYNNSGWAGNRANKFNDQPIVPSGTKAGRGGQKGYPNKCLVLLPHRFAIGCIDRGWILRNDVIWAKPNGMPEPVTDRFTKKHEYIFFMVKSEKYYFNLDDIRDKSKTISKSTSNITKYGDIENEKNHRQGMHKDRGNNIILKRYNLPNQKEFVDFLRSKTSAKYLSENSELSLSMVEHWFRYDESGFSYPSVEDWNNCKDFIDDWGEEFSKYDQMLNDVTIETDDINKNIQKGKNPGSVSDFWEVTTKASSDSHFASYNTDLIKKPILAGCPEGGIIYDPFMGTGTTAIAALRSNRNFIGSEMSTEYIKICENNIKPYLEQTKLF